MSIFGMAFTDFEFKTQLFVIFVVASILTGIIGLVVFFLEIPLIYGVFGMVIFGSIIGLMITGAFGANGSEVGLKVLAVILIIIILVVEVSFYGALYTANTYDATITQENGNMLFANDTLPYNHIPIVSDQYAQYIASSHIGDFGGNTKIVDNELIVYNHQPYWIFSIAPTNTFAVNHLLGFIMVNAVNGNFTEYQQHFDIGAKLWLGNNIMFHVYLNDVTQQVGNHYPQYVGNNTFYYIQTLVTIQPNGNQYQAGGIAYDKFGNIIVEWNTSSQAPSWVNQPWDKSEFSTLISLWAGNRVGNHQFGFFAGGFLGQQASPYMFAVDNNSELIPYHNGTAYMQFLSPANAPNALSGVILETGSHGYFYNMQSMELISATAAKATIQSKLPALSGASYFTANPVLYPVGNYYAWIVPYYSQESSTGIVQLQGLGIIDAQNPSHLVSIQSSFATISSDGITKLMNSAVEQFLNGTIVQPPTGNTTNVTGVITNLTHFEQNGSTIVAIEVNGTYYYGSASVLPDTEMVKLLELQKSTVVTLKVVGTQIVGIGS